jgi:hypothetical protein
MTGWATLADDAAELRRLHEEVMAAFDAAPHSERHLRIARECNDFHHVVADWWRECSDRARGGDTVAIRECIAYLEAWPWFPGSGYLATRIRRRLRQCGELGTYRARYDELERSFRARARRSML